MPFETSHEGDEAATAQPRPGPAAIPDHLPGLTPLRGVAALWVVIYHYAYWYFPNLHPERVTHLVGSGYLAVDLFFILSGFVLAHVYRRPFREAPGWRGYFNFLQARVARLYPLHATVLLAMLAVALVANAIADGPTRAFTSIPLEGARSLTAFFANLFMLQGLRASLLSWNYPAWSISTEFTAYLALPLLLLLVLRGPAWLRLALGLLVAGGMIALASLHGDDFDIWNGPLTLLRVFPEFLGGILLYRAYRHPAVRVAFRSDAVFALVLVPILLGLHFGAPDVAVAAMFFPLLLAAVSNEGRGARLLALPPLLLLGELSYALYLVHGGVQYAATRSLGLLGLSDRSQLTGGQSFLLCALMVGTSLLLAALAHRTVEVPGRRLFRRPLGP
ncbi:MAG: acyltransferase [Acetobacteraceae bacterium]|nr:acyltransferase [Acetobacteraceae bacterium]